MGNRRAEGGFQNLAFKSLEKWRRLSSVASVDELLDTLKRMKKRETVKRIQREVQRPGSSPSLIMVHAG